MFSVNPVPFRMGPENSFDYIILIHSVWVLSCFRSISARDLGDSQIPIVVSSGCF